MFCHLQTHNSHFGDKHDMISIEVYELSPGKYKNVFCELHNKMIEIACEDCKKQVCTICDLIDEDCAGKYRSLAV